MLCHYFPPPPPMGILKVISPLPLSFKSTISVGVFFIIMIVQEPQWKYFCWTEFSMLSLHHVSLLFIVFSCQIDQIE